MPLAVFIAYPYLALIPAAIFSVLYRLSRRKLVASAGFVWLLYGAYEYGMHARILCSGECNIRVDLLLLYPILLIVSITAATVGILGVVRQKRDGIRS
jgi:hypothetical protein